MNHCQPLAGDRWRLRSDLSFSWVNGALQHDGYWVVKDPLAREWFCLTPTEKSLLELADGGRSIQDLCGAAKRMLKPLEANLDSLVTFYVQARSKGLLVLVGASGPLEQAVSQMPAIANRGQSGMFGKLVAYRFSGFNPNVLGSLPGWMKHAATSNVSILVAVFLALAALAIVIARFDVLSNELARLVSRRDPIWLLSVLVVVGVAKSIHELSHVAACRSVGAECREIGVMLLFGTPSLYCDVSDLWGIPDRGRRVFVSAAGMLAELGLAAVATIIWAVTYASMVHDLALIVMVVCSVSTVLVNGNPLLRYDGYFMLADWLGVPNLAQRAGTQLLQTSRSVLWGSARQNQAEINVGRSLPSSVFLLYAICSLIYRMMVVLLISLLIYHAAVDFGLGWLGLSFALALLGGTVYRGGSALLEPLRSNSANNSNQASAAESTRWWHHPRARVIFGLMVLLSGFGFVVPIPMHLRIPVLLVADQQQDLYAVESGRVIALADSGAMVEPGDVLIEMANDELEDQLQQFAAELAVAETIVQANQSRKGTDQASSSALALAVKVRDSAEKNWQQARARVQRLTVRSPMSGRFTQRVPHPTEIRDRRFHVGHWVPAGTTVGWVGHPQERFGYAMATQGQIDRIQRGQRVRVCHQSLPTEYLFGRVQQVERTAWQTIPSELSAENLIIDEQSPNRVAKRTEAKYLVRIDLEPVGAVELPLRLVAIAEISVEPTSLWNRLRRLVADEYRGL